MPNPKPLIQCTTPELIWREQGTPASQHYDDIYFSSEGAILETETVFLKACGLPERWKEFDLFTICELGFGSGANFLTTMKMWQKTKPKQGRLHYLSVEKHPLEKSQLQKILESLPELKKFTEELIKIWPGPIKGFHRLHFGDVTLTLIHDDASNALDEMDACVDAWFLDGFSPSKNPEMWSDEIIKKIYHLSAAGARLGTFTAAGSVKKSLEKAGFKVNKKKGFGRKRHRIEATLAGKRLEKEIKLSPTIIGAGIAGASLTLAFKRRGIIPQIIHDKDFIAASHNNIALVKPRLDLQDRPESRFFLGSYIYALNLYNNYSPTKGVVHIPKSKDEITRFKKLCSQSPLPKNHLKYDSLENKLILGESLVISPKLIIHDWLKNIDLGEKTIEESNIKFLAAGFGLKNMPEVKNIPLRFSRGQITSAKANLNSAVSYGGYAIPVGEQVIVGATHNRLDEHDPFIPRKSDDIENINNLKKFTGITATVTGEEARSSVRVTSKNTLPIISMLNKDTWLFTGLGSRGFTFAPLLAEAIVSKILKEPMPIGKSVWAKFNYSSVD
jgi:tRNA 5-methylaminomethyl-2-thiouridine biosynthesis bifunctional protein